jgi:transcriptional regulator with XRE-family HTH domain
MKKKKLTMTITKEDVGFSAHVLAQNISINTQGDDLDELKTNILDAVNLAFENERLIYTSDDIVLKPDIQSFFEFYKIINAKALSERIGMNQSLLAQYIKGIKKPSKAQADRILEGIRQLGKEFSQIGSLLPNH